MLQGDYRGSIQKAGPRELTYNPQASGDYIANCLACTARRVGIVGEHGGLVALLPHGWYELQTDVDLYWMQVNPDEAATANPLVDGGLLPAGGCGLFFVDMAKRDGCLVVYYPLLAAAEITLYADRPQGISRVVRKDTIAFASVTGDDASLPSAHVSNACDK